MNLFFDVDYTILGVDGSLRPRTKETFSKLKGDGHDLYIWSGVGVRTYEVEKHDLAEYVSGVYRKPLEDFEEGLRLIGIPVQPDLVVDDYPEIVEVFGGVNIKPYYFARRIDEEMDRVYRIIVDYHSAGSSDDPIFRLPPRINSRPKAEP